MRHAPLRLELPMPERSQSCRPVEGRNRPSLRPPYAVTPEALGFTSREICLLRPLVAWRRVPPTLLAVLWLRESDIRCKILRSSEGDFNEKITSCGRGQPCT